MFVPLNFLYGAALTRLQPPEKNDFTSYYVASQVVRQGMPEALYYPEPVGSLLAQASVQHPWIDVAVAAGVPNPNYYLYPPLFAVVMLPLAWLPYGTAFALWLAANVVFLALALLLFMRTERDWTLTTLAACVLFAGTFHPVWHHLKIGQSSLLVLLLLSLCLAFLRRGRDLAAGLALSGAILLKLTPALLLALLAIRGRWKAAFAALTGVVVLSLASVPIVGWEAQETYFARMVPLLSAGTAFHPNQSLNGFLTRALGFGEYRKADLSAAFPIPRIAAVLVGVVVVGISLRAVWRRRRDQRSSTLDDGFATLVLASLLVSPISWEHHYVVALVPAWILARRWTDSTTRRAWVPWAAGLALALAGSYVGVNVFEKFGPGPLRHVLDSAAFLGGTGLWALFVSGAVQPGGSAGRERSPRREAWSSSAAARVKVADRGSRPASAPLLTFMAVFAASQFVLKVAEYDTSFEYGDFTSYYVAAAAVGEGKGEDLYYPATSDDILAKATAPSVWRDIADARGVRDANYYLYPPFFAVLAAPLGALSYHAAHDVWYLINLAALAGFLVALVRSCRPAGVAEAAAAAILAAVMWPALFTFGAGQANYVILLFVFGSLVAAERGKDAAAGLLIAAAAAIKLTPALLAAYFLWKRRWAIAAWTAGGLAAFTIASAAVVGMRAHSIYVTEMMPLLARGCAHWVNQSVSAFLSRLAGADMFDWSLAPPSLFVRAASTIVSLGFIAAAAWVTRGAPRESTFRLEFALILVTTLFISPISWIHHAVLSLPALFYLLFHLARHGRLSLTRALLLACCFTLIGIYLKPPGLFQAAWLTPLASYHLAGQVLLWVMLAIEIDHARKERMRPEAAAAVARRVVA